MLSVSSQASIDVLSRTTVSIDMLSSLAPSSSLLSSNDWNRPKYMPPNRRKIIQLCEEDIEKGKASPSAYLESLEMEPVSNKLFDWIKDKNKVPTNFDSSSPSALLESLEMEPATLSSELLNESAPLLSNESEPSVLLLSNGLTPSSSSPLLLLPSKELLPSKKPVDRKFRKY